jgi:hypothetical protein
LCNEDPCKSDPIGKVPKVLSLGGRSGNSLLGVQNYRRVPGRTLKNIEIVSRYKVISRVNHCAEFT